MDFLIQYAWHIGAGVFVAIVVGMFVWLLFDAIDPRRPSDQRGL